MAKDSLYLVPSGLMKHLQQYRTDTNNGPARKVLEQAFAMLIVLGIILTGFQPAFHAALHVAAEHSVGCSASLSNRGSDRASDRASDQIHRAEQGQDAGSVVAGFFCYFCSTPVVTATINSPSAELIPSINLFLQQSLFSCQVPIGRLHGTFPPRGPPLRLLPDFC